MLFRFLTDNSPVLWCVSSCTRSQCVLLLSIFGLVFTCVCLWCSFASRGSPHELQRRKGFAEDKIKFLQSNPYGLAHLAGLRQEKKHFSFFSQCSLVVSLIPYVDVRGNYDCWVCQSLLQTFTYDWRNKQRRSKYSCLFWIDSPIIILYSRGILLWFSGYVCISSRAKWTNELHRV
jgi:hypothetical protein